MQNAKDVNKAAYEGGGHTRVKLEDVYLAGKMLHIGIFPLVEEDVIDGTLAANHKAIILPGVNFLEPRVIAALEAFAASGGAVLLTDDCQVQIKGAQKIGRGGRHCHLRFAGRALDERSERVNAPSPAGALLQAGGSACRRVAAKAYGTGR